MSVSTRTEDGRGGRYGVPLRSNGPGRRTLARPSDRRAGGTGDAGCGGGDRRVPHRRRQPGKHHQRARRRALVHDGGRRRRDREDDDERGPHEHVPAAGMLGGVLLEFGTAGRPDRHRARRQPLVHDDALQRDRADEYRRRAGRSIRSPLLDSQPEGLTVGPDGRLWFTEAGINGIGASRHDGTDRGLEPSRRIERAVRHHRGARRGAVVHGEPLEQGRANDDRRRRHERVRRPDSFQRPFRDHQHRSRTLVHRIRRRPDRPDHDRRASSPSTPGRATSPRRSQRPRTAPSGTPSQVPRPTRSGGSPPAGSSPTTSRSQRPAPSPRTSLSVPTRTSGSPSSSRTRSAGSSPHRRWCFRLPRRSYR